jgi:Ca2+-binding RTX toxin-like protein
MYTLSEFTQENSGLLTDFWWSIDELSFNLDLAVDISGNDHLTGSEANDVLLGLGGNDTISGLSGDDLIFGGTGKDILEGGIDDDRRRSTPIN